MFEFNKKRIYLIFFLVYCLIPIFEFYYFNYIPLFYLDILKYSSIELAFVQIFPYLSLIITPFLSYYYDKYVNKEVQSKIILYTSCFILCGSFLIFILFKHILILFAVFLFFSLFSVSMIRTVMINLFLNIIKDSNSIKKKLIFIVRIANIISYLGISLFFQFIVTNINSLRLWNSFFIIGWFFSFSFVFIIVLLNSKIHLFYHDSNENQLINQKNDCINDKKTVGLMFILYIVFFLGCSDYLFMFLFSSWIYNKFGALSWRIYNSFYFIFIISEFLGCWIAYNLNEKLDKRKLIFIGFYLYMFIMIFLTISNFLFLMILNFFLFLIGSICNFTYTSIVADISKNKNHKTFKYQLLHTYQSLARIVFIPLGLFLYFFITVEKIIIISTFLLGISGMFILSTFFYNKK